MRTHDADYVELEIFGQKIVGFEGEFSYSYDTELLQEVHAAMYQAMKAAMVASGWSDADIEEALGKISPYVDRKGGDITEKIAIVDNRYPHLCPRCKGPAYIGAFEVDCQKGCK